MSKKSIQGWANLDANLRDRLDRVCRQEKNYDFLYGKDFIPFLFWTNNLPLHMRHFIKKINKHSENNIETNPFRLELFLLAL